MASKKEKETVKYTFQIKSGVIEFVNILYYANHLKHQTQHLLDESNNQSFPDETIVDDEIIVDENPKNNSLCYGVMNKNNSNKLIYVIPYGTTTLIFNDVPMKFKFIVNDNVKGLSYEIKKYEELFIIIEGNNWTEAKQLLDEFYIEANDFYDKCFKDKLVLYTYNHGYWNKQSEICKKNVDTLYLDKNTLNDVTQDIDQFLISQDDYNKFCRPYKRIYLFHGAPGTGKTSLVVAMASLYNKNIHMMNFTEEVNDIDFIKAVHKIDKNGILLIEDIDLLFEKEKEKEKTTKITFSGLINVLDGVCKKDGLMIFMTTNYIEKIDSILKREGRIDYQIEFVLPKKDQFYQIFLKYFPNQQDKFTQFYAIICKYQLTIAFIQEFFFKHRNCNNILDKSDELRRKIELMDDKTYQNNYS